ncbi:MAG: hypothetical protein QF848_02880 [Planctomycetota bacterium]|nr:hypothetical protein [Planctomycetota bacterium]
MSHSRVHLTPHRLRMAALPLALLGASHVAAQSLSVVEELRLSEGVAGFSGPLADGDGFGASLASIGDLNGDGVDDWAVGAPLTDGNGQDRGAIWILFMRADGTVDSARSIGDGLGGLGLTLADGDRFGHALASVPDLNGDGRRELCVSVIGTSFGGTAWPGGSATSLGASLPALFEPSGCVWHAGLQQLVVVSDDGRVALVETDGSVQQTFLVGGDLEAVAVPDETLAVAYLGVEHPDTVIELDLTTGLPTGESWDLTPWMQGANSRGLESLTVVQGLVYAGLQESGEIFVFDLQQGSLVQFMGIIPPPGGRDELSGLHYEASTDILYAVYDPDDLVLELTPSGSALRAYFLPGSSQEGVTLVPGCPGPMATFVVAEDNGDLNTYATYPAPCDGSRQLWGRGGVDVLFLAPDGSVASETWIASGSGGFGASLDAGDFFGSALASLGDRNGDGLQELAVGAAHDDDSSSSSFSQRGAVYLLSLTGSGQVSAWSKISATSGGFGGTLNDGDGFGASLTGVGDVDGDGATDLVVGTPYSDWGGGQTGSLWTCLLDAAGTVTWQAELRGTDIGAQAGEALGAALAQAAGDWTGGLPGMLVGSPTGGDSAAGAIRVLALDSGGSVSESHLIDGANGGLSGPLAAGDGLGFGLATAGDSDGDGMSELLAGAPGDDGAGNGRGAAWALELKRDSLGVGFCYADGTCPCGNAGTGAAGCANSVGTGGAIFPSGSASITADDLMLSVSGLPPSKFGLIFMGDATIPALPMADGMRCVSGSLFRFGARLSDGSGVLTEGPGIVGWTWNNLGSAGHILAGDTWSFQCWYRDLKGPCGTGSNASSALAITFVL